MDPDQSAYTFVVAARIRSKSITYLLSVLLALSVGLFAALLTRGGMRDFSAYYVTPSFSPPDWVFPVVWSALYLLMGISAAMVRRSFDDNRKDALQVYALQLFLNFGWVILFFGFHLLFAAFVWIILLEAVIVVMIAMFIVVRPVAGYLQIPYFLWVAFAAYLNFSVFLLNR